MKPETLHRLKIQIMTLSDFSLNQFLLALLDEIQRRKKAKKHPPKSPRRGEFKDCEPIRGY